MKKIYSKENIQNIDQRALESMNIDSLINEVGQCLASWFKKNISKSDRILILTGPGNNGKDGLALAAHLEKDQYQINCCSALEINELSVDKYGVVVDAVFGTSIDRDLPSTLVAIFEQINFTDKKKVAIDISSGVDANTGKIWGGAFKADHTLAIGGVKRGSYLSPGNEYAGEINVIEVPTLTPYFKRENMDMGHLIVWNSEWLDTIRPKKSDHKYSRGKLSVVMGEKFPGAALMVAYAAQKIGVGYVQIFSPEKILAKGQIEHPSFVFKPYSNVANLVEQLMAEDSDVYSLGSGWTSEVKPFWEFLNNKEKTILLDGGFLIDELFGDGSLHENTILTPHTGELKNLSTGETKWQQVLNLKEKFPGVVVAKGYDTIIYQQGKEYSISEESSPFLSVAGTGDVLAGMISGLAAQGLELIEAAAMAVYLHNHSAAKINWGLTPEVLIEQLPKSLKELSTYCSDGST